MLSFVPADLIPIGIEQLSYFHLALIIFTSPKLLCFSSKYLVLPQWKRSQEELFPSFPADVDKLFSK